MQLHRTHPFVVLTVPLVLGIVAGDLLRLRPGWFWVVPVVLLLVILLRYVLWPMPYAHRGRYGWYPLLFFFLYGWVRVLYFPAAEDARHYSRFDGTEVLYVGQVVRPPVKKRYLHAIVRIDRVQVDGKDFQTNGKLYATFPDSVSLAYGDVLVFSRRPRVFGPPRYPYGFDFGRYNYYRNIIRQVFLEPDDFVVVRHGRGRSVLAFAYRMRARFQNVLRRVIPDETDRAVAQALSLGVKDDLSPQIKEAFARTGAMHVLAVSGLHVGIVSIGLRYLVLALLGEGKKRRRWGLLIQLAGVWFFALMTGAGPAVLRAALMFSIIETGVALGHSKNLYNSLAASAFFLLMLNPFLLFQVGFQLSYLALGGIVFFFPYLYRIMIWRSRVLDYVWQMVCVSVAAQLTTFPLSVYYFHRFPVTFILSGPVVIPMAMVQLPLTLLTFLADFVSSALADGMGRVTGWSFHLTNSLIAWLSGLTAGAGENWYFAPLTTALCLLLVVTTGYWLANKRKRTIYAVMALLVLLVLERNVLEYHAAHQAKLAFYRVRGQDVVGFINGHIMYYYAPGALPAEAWHQATAGLRVHCDIDSIVRLPAQTELIEAGLLGNGSRWFFRGTTVLLAQTAAAVDQGADILYLRKRAAIPPAVSFKPRMVVSAPALSARRADKAGAIFQAPVYPLGWDGGLVADIRK